MMLPTPLAWPLLLVAVALSVEPGQTKPPAAAPAAPAESSQRTTAAAPAVDKPYRSLFAANAARIAAFQMATASLPSTTTESQPRIVCGLTVVPVDPQLDAKMRAERPPDNTHYSIKKIEPTVCKQ